MNYFLMLIILLLCGGGFYEYNIINSRHEGDVQRLADIGTQDDALKNQNAKLTADNAKLTSDTAKLAKAANDDQTQMADLTKQVQDAQAALAAEKQKEAPAVTSVSNPLPTPGTNNLGTVGTLDGKSYPNSQLMKVQADCIVVSYSGGITQIAFSLMPPDLQTRFGFDSKVAVALTPEQVAVQELKRKAAGSTAGN